MPGNSQSVPAIFINEETIGGGGGGPVAWASITGKPATFPPSSHTNAMEDITGLMTALAGKASLSHSHDIADVGLLQEELDSKAAVSHTHAIANVTGLQTALDGKAASSHTHSIANVTGLQAALDGKAAALSYAQVFATAETTISAATYADITGCSVTLAAGTWIIFAHVVTRQPNAIFQAFIAITDSTNTVIAESAVSRPASGTASLNSPIACNFQTVVTPTGSTTYKLRAARGLTTHTGSYVVMDGNGVNTTNHASNNTDKGTSIIAIKIA